MMDTINGIKEDDEIELPPGFRFHPSDEELITHYLSRKYIDSNFCAKAIGEVDMNKVEPWDLPWKAKIGEKEWYFFCVKDKKYPTGTRTNRATAAGYWKATGKDKDIFRGKSLVGMKKTLVFYRGRAPKGEKSNWVSHEYRLEGKLPVINLPKTAVNEWVICRVFQKSNGGKKVHISGLPRLNSIENDTIPSFLPPLMDSSSFTTEATPSESTHVSCFSNPIDAQKVNKDILYYLNNPIYSFSSNSSDIFPRISTPNMFYGGQFGPIQGGLQYSSINQMQDQSILRGLMENNDQKLRQGLKTEEKISVSQETGLSTDMNTDNSSVMSNLEMGRRSFNDQDEHAVFAGPINLDCLWNY